MLKLGHLLKGEREEGVALKDKATRAALS